MTAVTHPWTFIHPACKRPAFHAAGIPKLTTPVHMLELEHLDGGPMRLQDPVRCESCSDRLGGLEFAAMTVEANWRRRASAARMSTLLPALGSMGEAAGAAQ